MKKRFAMKNLDCANCAAKMEAAIGKIDGVQSVSVNFLTQKLTLEAPEDRFDEILELAAAACKKVDADCQVVR
ncbi:MAG TPA: heavy-metal-associated domain-containing protein [Candidatus Avoscillospira stercoripullorum]|uniref:Heavy-metal-associated domain-containing protein n=1 Tax=Candidatus Avoscillospira stercoripullorum TaxID=2840709 RepID=A0A9D1A8I4_9FIRM|nr:heavy-metal-associated domain-containing protein [Candidatus Avoscillospira stercoripullorum]